MSLKTSLNAGDFEPTALKESSVESQAPNQDTPVQDTSTGGQHQPTIPYPRFQEVTHENQSLRQQVQQYEARLAQVQAQQMQPQISLSGQQAPQQFQNPQQQLTAQQQQAVDSFRERLNDPAVAKEWQTRIAKEGPRALGEFVDSAIRDVGANLLNEHLRPILEKVQRFEADYVGNTVERYAQQVNDPEFAAYRHLFENGLRQVAPNNDIRNPQVLDMVRYWAQTQYRSQWQQQPSLYPQQNFQPPVTERPGANYPGFQQAPQGGNRFASTDQSLAQKFGLDPAAIEAARNNMVRSR